MSRTSGTAELLRLMILNGEIGPGGRGVEVHVAGRHVLVGFLQVSPVRRGRQTNFSRIVSRPL